MAYTVSVGGSDRTSLVMFKSLNITLRADHRDTCNFTIKTTAGSFLPRAGHAVVITESAATVFAGIVESAPQTKIGLVDGTSTDIFVKVSAQGHHSIPYRRVATGSYTATDADDIVNALITGYLDDDGISAGTVSTGANMDFNLSDKTIGTALDNLASASGYQWYIDSAKALHFLQEISISDAAHDLVEGGAYTDFGDVQITEDLDQYRNRQIIRGGIKADGTLYSYTAENSAEITARATIEGGTGIYEDVFTDTNIINDTMAATVASNLLKKHGLVPLKISFESMSTDWRPATKLKVNLPSFGISTDRYFLIETVYMQDIGGGLLRCLVEGESRDATSFSTQPSGSWDDYFKRWLDNQNNTIPAVNTRINYTYPYEATVTSTLEHDTAQGLHNSLVKIDDTHMILAYLDASVGNLKTFSVDSNYAVTEIDKLAGAGGSQNSLIMMDSTHFVLAYTGSGSDGYVATYSIDGSYDTITNIDLLEHDTSQGTYSQVVKLDDTHFVIAYTGASGVGKIKTFSVDGSYDTITEIDSLQHDAGSTAYNKMIAIDSTHVALTYYSYTGGTDLSIVKTFTIDGSYNIVETDDMIMAVFEEDDRAITLVDSTHFIVACTGGTYGTARVRSIGLDGSYNMSLLDTVSMNNASAWMQAMVMFDNTHLVNATYLTGPDDASVNVLQLDWTYAAAQKYSFVYDSTRGTNASLVKLDDSHVAIAYAGADNDGFIKILAVTTR